ncbi:IclR family transcriptional regulator [Herbiconiux daphne]|uniref:IclR family transcriptional regulator n=1 Tax=Herbiconiux daphne TaxID=2970914 RepID=A0ABT2H723_9MICO|nr:IclR family transcriptional regulator [Herbiconiux daphne]MCS5735734.1 IclR family transcriptional regulator [Herbiconiux daphne]
MADAGRRNQDQGGPSSVERALLVLESCAKNGSVTSISEITRDTGIPKSSVHRLCWNLTRLGALTASENGFTIGVRILAFGGSNPWLRFLRTAAAPVLHGIAAETGLVSNLAILAGNEAMIVDEIFTSQHGVPKEVGRQLPVHASAIGKALLMGRPRTEVERILGAQDLSSVTASTLTDRDPLWEQLQQATERGFVVSLGEWRVGRFGVAAPITSNGRTVASVGLIGLSATPPAEGIGASIRLAASEISARLVS